MNRRKLARILIEEGLIPASATRKTAGPEKIEVGDRVGIQTRKGKVEAIVAEVTHSFRARKYPYEARLTTSGGDNYKISLSSDMYTHSNNLLTIKFLGKSDNQKAIDDSLEKRKEVEDKKMERAETNSDTLLEFRLNPGDVIVYRYRNTTRNEVVAGVNYKTGKVGIERFTEPQKARYLEILKNKRQDTEDLKYFAQTNGLDLSHKKGPSDRSVRWLPSSGIVSVVSRFKG